MPTDSTYRPTTILYVEDHADTTALVVKLLGMDGFHVIPALTLRDARLLAEGTRFDLLMADVGLPDGEPIELLREMQQRHPVLGIIISGYPEPERLEAYLSHGGFCEYLVKPINFDTLRGAVQRCADKVSAMAADGGESDRANASLT